jgi:hypothetical protein
MSAPPPERLLKRIRAEFLEMPGAYARLTDGATSRPRPAKAGLKPNNSEPQGTRRAVS